MKLKTDMAPWLATLALLLSACTSGSDGATDDKSSSAVQESSQETTPVETDNTTLQNDAVPSDLPLVLAVASNEATISLETASEGGGKHPLLQWSELDGVDYYGVYVYAPSGDAYWFWRGAESSIYVGGSVQLDDDAMGVAITAEMTWGVVGYSEDGEVVGVSVLAPLAP